MSDFWAPAGLAIVGIIILFLILPNLPLYGDAQDLELRIHDQINNERSKNGLPPLKYDPTLANIARKHSEDMASNGFFDHVNYAGEDPSDRAKKANYSCDKNYGTHITTGIGENIMQNYSDTFDLLIFNAFDRLSTSTVESWMRSSGHRQNILDNSYDREGIGVYAIGKTVYITEDFC